MFNQDWIPDGAPTPIRVEKLGFSSSGEVFWASPSVDPQLPLNAGIGVWDIFPMLGGGRGALYFPIVRKTPQSHGFKWLAVKPDGWGSTYCLHRIED